MYSVTELLKQDPVIVTVQGCDVVCAACPHNVGGFCDSAEKAAAYDEGVISALGIAVGDRMCWSELCVLTKERIIGSGRLNEVCQQCKWLPVCENQVLRQHRII